MNINVPKLCYVKDNFAYFTTQDLSKQTGDDHDDAPYDCNSGEPYEYCQLDKEKGIEPWVIIKIAFDGWFNTPADMTSGNCPYSVNDINNRAIPWLSSWDKKINIFAGSTIEKFKELIQKGEGNIYIKED